MVRHLRMQSYNDIFAGDPRRWTTATRSAGLYERPDGR